MEKQNNKNQGNYRRGGLFMLPFVLIALIGAYFFNAPNEALLSIGIFGLGGSFLLIIIGKKKNKNK